MYIPHVTATDHGTGFRVYQAKTRTGSAISDVLIDGLVRKLASEGVYAATSEPPHGDPVFALTAAEANELQRGLRMAMQRRKPTSFVENSGPAFFNQPLSSASR